MCDDLKSLYEIREVREQSKAAAGAEPFLYCDIADGPLEGKVWIVQSSYMTVQGARAPVADSGIYIVPLRAPAPTDTDTQLDFEARGVKISSANQFATSPLGGAGTASHAVQYFDEIKIPRGYTLRAIANYSGVAGGAPAGAVLRLRASIREVKLPNLNSAGQTILSGEAR